MKDLIFLTDRFPFNNSEAFIENEIDIMASHFDRVFILPCGLMVNTETCRKVPENVIVIPPPCKDDIYKKKPSKLKKILWAINNLLPWIFACFLYGVFYKELFYLIKVVGFNRKRLTRIIRTLAPSLRNIMYYRRVLNKEDISSAIVYSYWIEPTILLSNKLIKQNAIVKTVCRGHGWDIFSERNHDNYLAFQRQIIGYVGSLYCVSENGQNYLSFKYPEYSKRIFLSRLGTKDYGLAHLPYKESPFIIVSCSHLIPIKRVERIIDAVSNLIKQENGKRDVIWRHFGTGQYKESIMNYAKEKLPYQSYEFMGEISNVELMNYYKYNPVDVFVNVSTVEGVPVSVMEAMSFGIPIIATDVGGTAEIVQHQKNGIVLDSNFVDDDLLESLKLFIENKIDILEYRRNSRMIWEERCSCITNYELFYKSLE